MKAHEIMTTEVLTVTPDTPVNEIATLLTERRISAVPVIDRDRRVVGIVSEGDLMRRADAGTERRRSWWLELISDAKVLAQDFVKSHGRRAADVMTRHVVSVSADTDVAKIADVLESRRIKRVPVLRDGKLVGIVSRADLLRRVATSPDTLDDTRVGDRQLHDAITARLRAMPWAKGLFVNVAVTDGEVELSGLTDSEEQRHAIRVLAETTPGTRTTHDRLHRRPRRAYAH